MQKSFFQSEDADSKSMFDETFGRGNANKYGEPAFSERNKFELERLNVQCDLYSNCRPSRGREKALSMCRKAEIGITCTAAKSSIKSIRSIRRSMDSLRAYLPAAIRKLPLLSRKVFITINKCIKNLLHNPNPRPKSGTQISKRPKKRKVYRLVKVCLNPKSIKIIYPKETFPKIVFRLSIIRKLTWDNRHIRKN